ncbi:hypothetical protein VPHD164_0022 [Vibrio phage D164]
MIVYLTSLDLVGNWFHSGQVEKSVSYDSNNDPVLGQGETIEVPPTVGANQIALLNDDTKQWYVGDNFIGTPYWNQNGTKGYVQYFDETVPEGTLSIGPTNVYHNGHDGTAWDYMTNPEIVAVRVNEIRQKRKNLFAGTVTVDGVTLEASSEALSSMETIITETIINGLVDIEWEYPDNTFTNYTVQAIKPVYKAIQNYRQDCFKEHKRLIDVLNASATPATEDIYAIDDGINPGWPTPTLTT